MHICVRVCMYVPHFMCLVMRLVFISSASSTSRTSSNSSISRRVGAVSKTTRMCFLIKQTNKLHKNSDSF